MKQVIFDYVQWQHNTASIYTALNDPKLRPAVPTVIGLTDGFTIICIPHSDSTLSPMTMSFGPQYAIEVVRPVTIEPVPEKAQPVSGISENTLLKALAIVKDSSLALQLIKD
jgi:hypothetical protein